MNEAMKVLKERRSCRSYKPDPIPQEVLDLAEARAEARKARDWAKSDALREQIKALGYIVEDSREGQKIKQA